MRADDAWCAVAELAASQHGVTTRTEAASRHFDHERVSAAIHDGLLAEPVPRVLTLTTHPPTFQHRLMVAVKAGGGTVALPSCCVAAQRARRARPRRRSKSWFVVVGTRRSRASWSTDRRHSTSATWSSSTASACTNVARTLVRSRRRRPARTTSSGVSTPRSGAGTSPALDRGDAADGSIGQGRAARQRCGASCRTLAARAASLRTGSSGWCVGRWRRPTCRRCVLQHRVRGPDGRVVARFDAAHPGVAHRHRGPQRRVARPARSGMARPRARQRRQGPRLDRCVRHVVDGEGPRRHRRAHPTDPPRSDGVVNWQLHVGVRRLLAASCLAAASCSSGSPTSSIRRRARPRPTRRRRRHPRRVDAGRADLDPHRRPGGHRRLRRRRSSPPSPTRGAGPRAGFAFEFDDPDAPYTVVLAEGDEVDALCSPTTPPASTRARSARSSRSTPTAGASPPTDWPADAGLEAYRQMLVNHEVGHLLGQHHPDPQCPTPGEPAPVMAQQSTELDDTGCLPNPWPLDWEIDCAAQHVEPLAPPYDARRRGHLRRPAVVGLARGRPHDGVDEDPLLRQLVAGDVLGRLVRQRRLVGRRRRRAAARWRRPPGPTARWAGRARRRRTRRGAPTIAASTSSTKIFSPPELMVTESRPSSSIDPSASCRARSPGTE